MATGNTVGVHDSWIAYTDTDTVSERTGSDTGSGAVPVVFVHGNPTSSYLWRNVIPHVAGTARCLAPDLIGMGASGKPDIAYRFAEHADYLDGWFDALGLDEVVIVGQDWGGALGMDWAARHPGRVRGVAVTMTILRPTRWTDYTPQAAETFRAFRSEPGEKMVLQDNMFIESYLRTSIQRPLAPGEFDAYRNPYPDPSSRRPLLAWSREIPIDGHPADVHERVETYGRWMNQTPDVPKLLMTVEPGVGIGSPEVIAWAADTFASVEIESLGPAGHFAPEDQPDAIGTAINRWLTRHDLIPER